MTQAWTPRWDDDRPPTWTSSDFIGGQDEAEFQSKINKLVKNLEDLGAGVVRVEDSILVKWPSIGHSDDLTL